MSLTVDVAVVGGGVIGCSVAYHAARRGARTALLEAKRVGSGASGAAAGMLAAQAEVQEPGPFLDLLLSSRKMHKPFGEEIRELTGLDPGYTWAGTLRIASGAEGEEALAAKYRWQKQLGLPVRWLEVYETRELEPALSSDITAALHLPEDGQVDSPRLVQALALGAALKGTEILEGTRVSGFVSKGHQVTGIRTTSGTVSAGAVVLAGGVFGTLLSEGLGVHLPMRPVKGEILTVTARPAPVRANVWNDRCYVVPKRDGRVIIGATEEPDVYDHRPTLGGVAALSGAATRLVPSLAHTPFAGAWGGLRPGTLDGRPILGPVKGWEGLLFATGHYRNGILLSPITGEAVAALALGEASPIDVRPFLCERFTEDARW